MNNNKIFAEMMINIPLCTHYEAKEVLVLGTIDDAIVNEAKKHSDESNITFSNLDILKQKEEKSVDTIILTDIKLDFQTLSDIFRVLNSDGILTFSSSFYSKDIETLKNDLEVAGKLFWIVMPFSFGHTTSIIASKKYHPTADLNLNRAEFLEDMNYYSAEIHSASFVFPAKVHKELTGIAKR